MKPGARAVGVAESYTGDRSTLAGAVVRGDRVLDGAAFVACTVGGLDATDAVRTLHERLDREDVRYLLIAGVAPAWFNLIDLPAIAEAVGRPVLSVSFEASEGLEAALRREFEDEALERRLAIYRRQPPRERVTVNDEPVFVRSVGLADHDADAGTVLRAFTPAGGRPEPLRVARLLARAGDAYRDRGEAQGG